MNPKVFEMSGIDTEKFTGFAFGLVSSGSPCCATVLAICALILTMTCAS